jgi:hypothetical protein
MDAAMSRNEIERGKGYARHLATDMLLRLGERYRLHVSLGAEQLLLPEEAGVAADGSLTYIITLSPGASWTPSGRPLSAGERELVRRLAQTLYADTVATVQFDERP